MFTQLTVGMLLTGAFFLPPNNDEIERITNASTVFEEIMASRDQSIPRSLLQRAHCIVIVPSVKRGGFIVGGQYGVGVASCRTADNTSWTGPSTVRVEGGSLGFQIGAGETDIIMLIMNENGAKRLMKTEFTIGAEGAAMAGPIGRAASAETDAHFRAEILSYSRSRGAFAGVALKGSTLRSDDKDNQAIYGKEVLHEDILTGKVPAPESAMTLIETLNRYSAAETQNSAADKQE